MHRLPENIWFGYIFILVFSLTMIFFSGSRVKAISNVISSFNVQGENIEPGSIVVTEGGDFYISTSEYSSKVFGVVVNDPGLALNDTSLSEGSYVLTNGEAFVKVSAVNGPISPGDYIVTSSQPGVGMRSTRSGVVLGTALEAFDPLEPSEVGQIWTFVDIGPVIAGESIQQNAFEMLKSGISAPFLTPMTSLRFLLAFIVVIISFFLGFISFTRITGNSIQALGRNPLASNVIKTSVFMNFMFTVAVIMVGIGVAYLILSV